MQVVGKELVLKADRNLFAQIILLHRAERTCGPKCFKLQKEGWEEAHDLGSWQEEADARMFLHAHHVAESQEYQAVVIVADDYQTWIIKLLFHWLCIKSQVHQESKVYLYGYICCQNVLAKLFVMHGLHFMLSQCFPEWCVEMCFTAKLRDAKPCGSWLDTRKGQRRTCVDDSISCSDISLIAHVLVQQLTAYVLNMVWNVHNCVNLSLW